jgi:predicted nucleotidyltransferase
MRMHVYDQTSLVAPVMASVDPRAKSAIERIVALVHPEAVLLFGSRARGDGDDASDWDLLVGLTDDAPPGIARPSALRRAAAPANLPIHAVACRRGVFEAKRNDPNTLSHDVARDGVVLYRRPA